MSAPAADPTPGAAAAAPGPSPAVTEFLNAVNALYNHPDDRMKSQANDWLSAFQRKPVAWEVADQVLHQPGLTTEFYYFAANTLRQKLCYDFADLAAADAKSRAGFRDSLLQHVLRFKAAPSSVRVRLALCVASLAVHLTGSEEWPTALDDLSTMLGRDSSTALFLLDILTVVPEECGSSKLAVAHEVRDRASKTFAAFAPNVLTMLHAYLGATGTNRDLQNRVLACLLSWQRQGGVEPEMMLASPLFNQTWEAINVPELFETSCDVIAEILHQSEDVRRFMEVLKVMIPRVLTLLPQYETAVTSENEDVARGLARIFIEMGESYVQFIAEGTDVGQTCARVLLTCCSHPNKELASHALNFWYLLSQELSRTTVSDERRERFFPHFAAVVEVTRVIMQYGDDYATWDADEKEGSKRYRYFAAETLLDATSVLGPVNTLRLIWTQLSKELEKYGHDSKQWQGLEASLYCVRSIARKVDLREAEIMPRVMELLPKLTAESQLRYTATLIVGRYSDWLATEPQSSHCLPTLLGYVVGGLNDKEVASSAALAFKYICEGCAAILAKSFIENLFTHVYANCRRLPLQDQKEIIDGMANVVSALPPETVLPGLERLIAPIAVDINTSLALPEADLSKEHEETGLLGSLDRLAQVFRCIDPMSCADENAVYLATVECVQKLWPIFENIIERFKGDEKRVERTCRCWKYAMKVTKFAFAPLLPALVTLLCKYYQTNPHSSFLYTVSICVDQFGPRSEFHPILQEVFKIFSTRTFHILKDGDSFRDSPEIVEDYFEMLSRFMRRCPDILFNTSLAPATDERRPPLVLTVFECGLVGMGIEHREACSALMQFFGLLIRAGVDKERENKERGARPSSTHVAILTKLLEAYGQELVNQLLQGISGRLPSSRVKFLIGVIESLLDFCKEPTHRWFVTTLAKLPEVVPSKESFVRALFTAPDVRSVRDAIYTFSKACRFSEH